MHWHVWRILAILPNAASEVRRGFRVEWFCLICCDQFLGKQFLWSFCECLNLMQFKSFCLGQGFLWWIRRMIKHLCLFCHSLGFKVETDVGINESYVPDYIFGMHFVLRVSKVQIWYCSIGFCSTKLRQRIIPIDFVIWNLLFCHFRISLDHFRDQCWSRWRLCKSLVFHNLLLATDTVWQLGWFT